MTYAEAVEWLYGLQLHGIKLGLENMRRLARTDVPACIHVAGTNGKGSVCAFLDSMCRAAGRRTGLYTSPHLLTFRERIRIDGEMISERDVARGLSAIRERMEGWQQAPTFFEVTTALALDWFREQGAQGVVLETGLGGRLDATNAVTPKVAVLTPIALDHTHYLGATLAAIAGEKAGIIKPGVPVVSAPQPPEARSVIERTAAERGSACHFIEAPWTRSPVGLAGPHQRWNAGLAVLALEIAEARVPAEAIERGLAVVQWPGRFQRFDERIVLDGAHNPAAAAALAEAWRAEFGGAKATLLFAAMRDKDVRGVLAALRPIAARVITVPVQNVRACTAADLCAMARDVDPAWPCEPHGDMASALAKARSHPDRILIAGSLFLVGEALAHLDPTSPAPERTDQ